MFDVQINGARVPPAALIVVGLALVAGFVAVELYRIEVNKPVHAHKEIARLQGELATKDGQIKALNLNNKRIEGLLSAATGRTEQLKAENVRLEAERRKLFDELARKPSVADAQRSSVVWMDNCPNDVGYLFLGWSSTRTSVLSNVSIARTEPQSNHSFIYIAPTSEHFQVGALYEIVETDAKLRAALPAPDNYSPQSISVCLEKVKGKKAVLLEAPSTFDNNSAVRWWGKVIVLP